MVAELGDAPGDARPTTPDAGDAAADDREHGIGQRGDHARLQAADLVRGVDEDEVDRGDTSAQLVGNGQLNGVQAHDHADLVGCAHGGIGQD